MEGSTKEGRIWNRSSVAVSSMRRVQSCCLRYQLLSWNPNPSATRAGNSSGCSVCRASRCWRKRSGSATQASYWASLSKGTQILFPRDGSMALSPHCGVGKPTVWAKSWNHPTLFKAFSPTPKSGGVREIEEHVTIIHLACDNVSTHHGQEVRKWLSKHPRFVFHFTPVHCSWMNQVEQWFSILQRKRFRIVDFESKDHLRAKIGQFIEEWNQYAHPFNWSTQSVAKVMAEAPALAA